MYILLCLMQVVQEDITSKFGIQCTHNIHTDSSLLQIMELASLDILGTPVTVDILLLI